MRVGMGYDVHKLVEGRKLPMRWDCWATPMQMY